VDALLFDGEKLEYLKASLDVNGDGIIAPGELRKAVRALGSM
jgi:hypothetical protein